MSLTFELQELRTLNYKSSGHWITRAIAIVIQYPITFENQKWMDLELQELIFSHFWVSMSRTLSFRGFANTDVNMLSGFLAVTLKTVKLGAEGGSQQSFSMEIVKHGTISLVMCDGCYWYFGCFSNCNHWTWEDSSSNRVIEMGMKVMTARMRHEA